MSSDDDPQWSKDHDTDGDSSPLSQSMESQLFESLVHHLIEKGVMTKNDALSVVQTVAEVKAGDREEGRFPLATTTRELNALGRLFSSFEDIRERAPSTLTDAENIVQLRPPLHGNEPRFPRDD